MKRIIALFLCLTLSLSILPVDVLAVDGEKNGEEQAYESPFAEGEDVMAFADGEEPSAPDNGTTTILLDSFLREKSQEYVVSSTDVKKAIAEQWSPVNDFVGISVKLNDLTANLSKSGSDYTGEEVRLAELAYTFEAVPDGYNVYSDRNGTRVYLNLGYKPGTLDGQGYPSQTTPATISVSADTSSDAPTNAVRITDNTIHTDFTIHTDLAYSKWDFFTRTDRGDFVQGTYRFFLYHLKDAASSEIGNFEQVGAGEIKSGEKYLIVAKVTANDTVSYMVLVPANNNTNRNAHTARISQRPKTDVFDPFTDTQTNTVVSFEAKKSRTQNFIYDGKTYSVRVQSEYEEVVKPVKTEITLPVGNSITVNLPVAKPSNSDIVVQPDSGLETVITGGSGTVEYKDYANRHAVKNLGTCAGYSGQEVDLSDCLYTFEAVGDAYKIFKGGVYLSVSQAAANGCPGTATETQTTLIDKGNGIFMLKSDNDYLAFRRNNWGVFFAKTNPYQVQHDGAHTLFTATDCEFRLYRPIESGEIGSEELKGYVRVESPEAIVSGKQYLIAAAMKDIPPEYASHVMDHDGLLPHLFFLYPSTTGAPNDHVVMANKTYSSGSSTVTFKAIDTLGASKSDVSTEVKVGNYTFEITVVDKHEYVIPDSVISQQSNSAANGKPINKITISVGTQYTFKPNAGLYQEGAKWSSTGEDVVSVPDVIDSDGTVTITGNKVSRGFERTYLNYMKDGKLLASVEVVVVTNSAGSSTDKKTYNYYIDQVVNTDVWYTWGKPGNEVTYIKDDFKQLQTHEDLLLTFASDEVVAIDYFAKGHDQCALVKMSATNSQNNYCSLTDSDDITQTEFYRTYYTNNQAKPFLKPMAECAKKELHCTGAMGFTLAGQTSSLSFISEELPSLSKKILTKTAKEDIQKAEEDLEHPEWYRQRYTDGMEVEIGDMLNYMVSIELKPGVADKEDLVYTNFVVRDELPGAEFLKFSINNETVQYDFATPVNTHDVDGETVPVEGRNITIPRPVKQEDGTILLDGILNDSDCRSQGITIKLYVEYIVSENDVALMEQGVQLVNTASSAFNFKSKYENSTHSGNAADDAAMTLKLGDNLKYVNLSLDGSIGLNLYFASNTLKHADGTIIQKDEKYENWASESGSYSLQIRVGNGEPHNQSFYAAQEYVLGNKEGYKKFSVPIAPDEMTQNISVYIVDSKGNQVANVPEFTVQDYVRAVLEPANKAEMITSWQMQGQAVPFGYAVESYEKLANMLKAMLNYGTAAQEYSGTNLEKLANSILDDEEKFYDLSEEQMNTLKQSKPTIKNDQGGARFIGVALQLNNGKTGIRVYFDPQNRPVNNTIQLKEAAIQVTSQVLAQDAMMGTLFSYTQKEMIHSDGNGYYVYLGEVPAHWLRSNYVVTATRVDAEGVEHVSKVELSALTYTYLLYSRGDFGVDGKLKNMGAAMYLYNLAAEQYFGSAIMSTEDIPAQEQAV